MRKLLLSPVSHLETNSIPSFDVFTVLKDSQRFSAKNFFYFHKVIDHSLALDYIDNIVLLAHTKTHVLDLIVHLHQISSSDILKIAPEKSFYTLLTVYILGYEIGSNTIKPISSKTELMRFIGSMSSCTKFKTKLHVSLKPFYTLLHDTISIEWTPEIHKLFYEIKTSL